MSNPYNWKQHDPPATVPRPEEVEEIERELRNGGSAVVVGGLGMGKSVFLRQIMAEVESAPEAQAFLFRAPPPRLTVAACLNELARQLGFDTNTTFDDAYLRFVPVSPAPRRQSMLWKPASIIGFCDCPDGAEMIWYTEEPPMYTFILCHLAIDDNAYSFQLWRPDGKRQEYRIGGAGRPRHRQPGLLPPMLRLVQDLRALNPSLDTTDHTGP